MNLVYQYVHSSRKTLSPAVEGTTDSEDQCSRIANRLSSLTLPANNSLVSGGDLESDSVNEIAIERKTADRELSVFL